MLLIRLHLELNFGLYRSLLYIGIETVMTAAQKLKMTCKPYIWNWEIISVMHMLMTWHFVKATNSICFLLFCFFLIDLWIIIDVDIYVIGDDVNWVPLFRRVGICFRLDSFYLSLDLLGLWFHRKYCKITEIVWYKNEKNWLHSSWSIIKNKMEHRILKSRNFRDYLVVVITNNLQG